MDQGADLYKRFRDSGDNDALAGIIRLYRDGLIYYLSSIVGNFRLAEELAEDTFVLLGTRKPRDKGIGSFKTWLYTIGRNLAINELRRRGRNREDSLENCPELAGEGNPEQYFLQEEEKRSLYRALGSLKAEYRQVLWLVYLEDMSHREAAAVMKKSVHSVDTLVYRARKALKDQMEQEEIHHERI